LSFEFVDCAGELTNLKTVASNQGISFNLVLSEYDPITSRIDFTNSAGSTFSFDIDISDENCSQIQHSAFQKSLEMGFFDRQKISNYKMKYAILTEDEISIEKVINEASSSCYEAMKELEGMIDCKIIQFNSPEASSIVRLNSSDDARCKSSSEVTLVARFIQNLDFEIKEEISANISAEIKKRLNSDDDKKAQSEVLNLLTPKGKKRFYGRSKMFR